MLLSFLGKIVFIYNILDNKIIKNVLIINIGRDFIIIKGFGRRDV